jgi:hypothetical protein
MERRDPADEPRVGTEVRDGGSQLHEWKTEEALVGVAECEDSQPARYLLRCRVEASWGLIGGGVRTRILPQASQDRSVKGFGTRAGDGG